MHQVRNARVGAAVMGEEGPMGDSDERGGGSLQSRSEGASETVSAARP